MPYLLEIEILIFTKQYPCLHYKYVQNRKNILKIVLKKGGGCVLFRDGVARWLYRWNNLLFPQSMYLVLVFVPGAKRYSFTGVVLSRLEASGMVNARFFNCFQTIITILTISYQAKYIKIF